MCIRDRPLTGISPQQQKADEIAGQAAAAGVIPAGTPATPTGTPAATPSTGTPATPTGTPAATPSTGTPATPSTGTPAATPSTGTPATPAGTPAALQPAAPSQAQVAPTQAPPAVSASVPQIMQQAEYEIPGGAKSAIVPIPIGGGSAPMMMGGGGTRLLPIGVSKQALLNSYYQAQLTGFLYKQG